MNKTSKATTLQLFSMMFLFFIGLASIFGYGLDKQVEQDAWIVSVLGVLSGLLLFTLYLFIYNRSGTTLPQMLIYVFGRPIGVVVSLLYALYFLMLAGRNIRDEIYILGTTFLPQTNPQVISIILLLLVAYAVCIGIIKFARATFSLFVLYLFLLAVLLFVGVLTKSFHFSFLTPTFDHSKKEIFHVLFPSNVVYPFGEGIAFLALLPQLKERVTRTVYLSLFLSGILLIGNTIFIIAVLGPSLANNTIYPFFLAVSQYNLTSFIERLDPIAVNLAIISAFVRVVVFVYAAHVCLGVVYKVKNTNQFLYFTLPVMYCVSMYISQNIVEQIEFRLKIINYPIHFPMLIYIPCLVALILLFKRKPMTGEI